MNLKKLLIFGIIFLSGTAAAFANDKNPPIPPQSIEGPGGIFVTPLAYLVSPAEEGKIFGKPVIGASWAQLQDKRFLAFTFSETLWDRVELSYAYDNLEIADLTSKIHRVTGMRADSSHAELHNFNLRVNLLKEGDYKQAWLPAVTAGIHYKYNATEHDLNKSLNGVLKSIGVKDDSGIDYTLTATKMFKELLPKPLVLSAGVRVTKASHIGLLGFSDTYQAVGEFNFAQFLTDNLALVGEYRMKPDKLKRIPGLVEKEDDWWDLAFFYVLNNHSSISVGYLNPGHVLNDNVRAAPAARLIYEF